MLIFQQMFRRNVLLQTSGGGSRTLWVVKWRSYPETAIMRTENTSIERKKESETYTKAVKKTQNSTSITYKSIGTKTKQRKC